MGIHVETKLCVQCYSLGNNWACRNLPLAVSGSVHNIILEAIIWPFFRNAYVQIHTMTLQGHDNECKKASGLNYYEYKAKGKFVCRYC